MIEYLTLEELLAIHSSMVKRFGGLAGIRDKNLLHSVIELPKSTMFGEDLYPRVFEKAAIYLFSIVRNHPLMMGIKELGVVRLTCFCKRTALRLNSAITLSKI